MPISTSNQGDYLISLWSSGFSASISEALEKFLRAGFEQINIRPGITRQEPFPFNAAGPALTTPILDGPRIPSLIFPPFSGSGPGGGGEGGSSGTGGGSDSHTDTDPNSSIETESETPSGASSSGEGTSAESLVSGPTFSGSGGTQTWLYTHETTHTGGHGTAEGSGSGSGGGGSGSGSGEGYDCATCGERDCKSTFDPGICGGKGMCPATSGVDGTPLCGCYSLNWGSCLNGGCIDDVCTAGGATLLVTSTICCYEGGEEVLEGASTLTEAIADCLGGGGCFVDCLTEESTCP